MLDDLENDLQAVTAELVDVQECMFVDEETYRIYYRELGAAYTAALRKARCERRSPTRTGPRVAAARGSVEDRRLDACEVLEASGGR